jgi:GT2 family glycosyltransferase
MQAGATLSVGAIGHTYRDVDASRDDRGAAGQANMWRGVFAVVYTYNRKELVAQCLDSIQRQSLPPERILLIDNGSTDGTRDYLAERRLLEDPRIEYVRLEANTGAAGGLRAGITHAYRRGCEWAWVMDDDVICDSDTLAAFKQAFDENFGDMSKVGFLISRLVGPDGRENNMPEVDYRLDGAGGGWAEFLAKGLIRVRISTLTSVLLPRTTLARCGVPSSDFFIWGEDTDYTLRITEWRPGYVVGGSRAVHLRGVPGFLDIFAEKDARRLRYFYYLYRNTLYLRRRFWPTRGVLLFAGKAMLHFVQALGRPEYGFLRARMIAAGTVAGFFFEPRPSPLSQDEGEPCNGSPSVRSLEAAAPR